MKAKKYNPQIRSNWKRMRKETNGTNKKIKYKSNPIWEIKYSEGKCSSFGTPTPASQQLLVGGRKTALPD